MRSVLRLNDGYLRNVFAMVGAWLSMSVDGSILLLKTVLCFGVVAIKPFALFHDNVFD